MMEGKKFVHIYFVLEPGMNAANASNETDTAYNNSNLLKYYFYKKERLPYFSGQAYRRWLRDTMTELTGEDYSTIVDDLKRSTFVEGEHYEIIKLKKKKKDNGNKDKKSYMLKKKMFEDFPGADVFGYMVTAEGSNSIIRQSPTLNTFVLGLLPRQFIKDVVTKSEDIETEKQDQQRLSYREATYNVYYGSMSIEYNRYGFFAENELVPPFAEATVEPIDFGEETRKEHLKTILNAFFKLRGGANAARLLPDLTPRAAIIVVSNNGNNIFPSMRPIVENNTVIIPKSFTDFVKKYYGEENVYLIEKDFGQETLVETNFDDALPYTDHEKIIDEILKRV